MRQYHVGVAAEAFAAGLFAQAGCDVLVQNGANQPLYDLMITRGGIAIHVSVKGSQDGGWGLIQSYKRGVTYLQAAGANTWPYTDVASLEALRLYRELHARQRASPRTLQPAQVRDISILRNRVTFQLWVYSESNTH